MTLTEGDSTMNEDRAANPRPQEPLGVAGLIQGRHPTSGPTTANPAPTPMPAVPTSGARTQPQALDDAHDHAAGAKAWPVTFTGSGSEYFRIWIVNLLLMIVTLTLYYPWAKVRKLRYFYGNTQVAGHALDFHGQPKQMLRGYLLVGALFVVYNFAFNVSPTAGLVALAIMAGIWPLLFRTSMRFRLANTSWRGLRFAFSGDAPGAYKALLPAFLPAILMFLVLALFGPDMAGNAAPPTAADRAKMAQFGLWFGVVGLLSVLAVPLMWWALKRYQHNHYALAQERTSFTAGAGSFYAVFLKAFGLLLLAALVFGVVGGLMSSGAKSTTPAIVVLLMKLMVFVVILLYALLILLVQPYVTARLQNLIWTRTESRAIGFESRLRARALLGLNTKNWLLIMLTLGLYWPFAAVAMARMKLQAVTVLAHQDLDQLVAQQRRLMKDATGDAAADVFGVDLGI
jgi:uncharacterized membrane protein YjgN (DUF898 family)